MHEPSSKAGQFPRSALAIFLLALVGSGAMLYYHLKLYVPGVLALRTTQDLGKGYFFGDDFYPIWLSLREWQTQHHDPYSHETTRAIQVGLFGRTIDPLRSSDPSPDYRRFSYPAFTDLLFWPVSAISFPTLRILLVALWPLLICASIVLWQQALGFDVGRLTLASFCLLTLCSYQGLEGIFALQPGIMVGFLLSLAFWALRRERITLSGVALALTTIKPQMTILVIFYLLIWSWHNDRYRLRFLVRFFAPLAAMVATSLFIWPRWIRSWMDVLTGYHNYSTPPLVSVVLGPTLGRISGPVLILLFLSVSAVLVWRHRRADLHRDTFWLTASVLLAITSVAVLPGQAVYDHVILIPALLFLIRDRGSIFRAGLASRVLLMAFTIILCWPGIAALGLILVRPWVAAATFSSPTVLDLPIRSVVSFPFAVLTLVGYILRIISGEKRVSA